MWWWYFSCPGDTGVRKSQKFIAETFKLLPDHKEKAKEEEKNHGVTRCAASCGEHKTDCRWLEQGVSTVKYRRSGSTDRQLH